MKIRPVQFEDYDSWKALWGQYNTFYERTIADEVTEVTWGRFLNTEEPMFSLVAESDEGVVGFTNFLYHRNTTMLKPVCYLQDLFTLENQRGKGVGRALIQAVDEHAKANGSVQVYWMTHESNDVARKLYDKVAEHRGFIIYSHRF